MNKKEDRLDHDMGLAIDCIINRLSEKPLCILLGGGYGRGEGAWFKDDKGKWQPYNDYDFIIVSSKALSREEYSKLRAEIALLVGIRWIDIDFYSPNYFNHLLPTIKNVDIVYASRVLFGDSHFLDNISVDPKKIGNADILKLHMTRIWTFLGSWEGGFHDLGGEEARFFRNQMCKAIFAAIDMYLIKNHLYDSSYRKRAEVIREVSMNNQELVVLVDWALSEKLEPNGSNMKKDEMEKLYNITRKAYMNALKENANMMVKCLSNRMTGFVYIFMHSKFLLHFIHDLSQHDNYTLKMLDVFFAQNYIFFAFDKGKQGASLCKKAKKILVKWGYWNRTADDWDSLRENVAFARNNI